MTTIDPPADFRPPTLPEALISLFSLVVGIGVSIYFFGLAPQIPMLFGVGVASLVAMRCGHDWQSIQDGMIAGITNALTSIIILMIVGVLIGVWILAGVVPTLVYYGLQVLSPAYFLAAATVICAIASLATGTSWGTTGTIGVALMGVGAGLGLPLPIVAGAVLSGAYFGDKMSPLSDTTNLAPAMVGTDLYTHIRHMLPTTGVSITISLALYLWIGMGYAGTAGELDRITSILDTLRSNFVISPILLLPPLLVMVVSFKKMPAIPGIALGALAGLILAFLVQGSGFEAGMNAAFSGFVGETGNPDVDDLLTRGGSSRCSTPSA